MGSIFEALRGEVTLDFCGGEGEGLSDLVILKPQGFELSDGLDQGALTPLSSAFSSAFGLAFSYAFSGGFFDESVVQQTLHLLAFVGDAL